MLNRKLVKMKVFGALILWPILIDVACARVQLPCNLNFGVQITNGILFENGSILSDGVTYNLENYIHRGDTTIGCVCNIKSCLRKCCPFGEFLQNKTCVPTDKPFVIPRSRGFYNVEHFHIVHGFKCKPHKDRLLLDPRNNSDLYEQFIVEKSGQLYVPSNKLYYNPTDYCIDYIEEDDEIQTLICGNDSTYKYRNSAIGMIISMPFLLLTFLVYAILPDRNLHGKCLMCYVITLFGAYALLVFIQLYPDDLDEGCCKALGIFCLFFFMVSFFWMNVMSIDIWWAFSGLRGFSGSRKEAERKRFILYCSYAWGMPMLLALVVTSLTVSDVEKNTWYNPGMGDGQCWFRDGAPTLVYFYGPMATLIIANITLFCITACKIKQVQQDTAMLRKDESKKHTYENDKQRFNLYLKLMLAMGVNWAMEIISWIVDWQVGHVPPAVWYITDFCNALYGVFVFFIFVFKQNIWKLLKRRYYMTIGKPHLARSMTQTTAYSPRTTGSSLNHNISTDKTFVTDSSVLTSEVA